MYHNADQFFFVLQDNVRNQLIQFELLLTTATFVVAIFGVVAGIFGMNFPISLFDDANAFKWVLIITGVFGIIIFFAFVWYFKYRRLMPLQTIVGNCCQKFQRNLFQVLFNLPYWIIRLNYKLLHVQDIFCEYFM